MIDTWKEVIEWDLSTEDEQHVMPVTVEITRDDYGCTAEVKSAPFGALTMTRATLVAAFGHKHVEAVEDYARNQANEAHPPLRDWKADEARAYRRAAI